MTQTAPSDVTLASFAAELAGPQLIQRLAEGLIGEGASFTGPFGQKQVTYADYVASGRGLMQVENFVLTRLLPFYANSHTEASYCGGLMTRLRREARSIIAAQCGAGDQHAVIFTGSGATAGLNRLVHLFGITAAAARGDRPLVLVGPYEHHSNLLVWRESGAEVIEVAEAETGGPDLDQLHQLLAEGAGRLMLGAFSAVSNVTGIVTDTEAVTRVLKSHGALAVWDYAGGAPYVQIHMGLSPDSQKDAVVFSAHKFIGGPAASGVTILRRAAVTSQRPAAPGGGTVRFVSPWGHDYSGDVVAREEAGTPDVLGDLRAALAMLVKQAIGQAFLDRRHAELRHRALAVWGRNPALNILGNPKAGLSLPIFSLQVRDLARGGLLHQQLFTRLLSDVHGIQARGGCACAGPYAHRLLGIDQEQSQGLRAAILSGQEMDKPGWTRLNLSALLSDDKADRIIAAVDRLAREPYPMADAYLAETSTARFRPAAA